MSLSNTIRYLNVSVNQAPSSPSLCLEIHCNVVFQVTTQNIRFALWKDAVCSVLFSVTEAYVYITGMNEQVQ